MTSVALLGTWHVHADDYCRQISGAPDTRFAAIWDRASDTDRAEPIASKWDVELVNDLDVILADDSIDAVIVADAPATKVAIIRAALERGKHVLTEKVLAPTVREVDELVAIARANDVILEVAYPFQDRAVVREIDAILASGVLGTLTFARVRLAIDGHTSGWLPERFDDPSQAVFGALGDLGCHAIYLLDHFLSVQAGSVVSLTSSVLASQLDDNAVLVASFPGGAIGVAETSHVGPPGRLTFVIELSGTTGTLDFGHAGVGEIRVDAESQTTITVDDDSTFRSVDGWLRHIEEGTPLEDHLVRARRLTQYLWSD